MLLQSSSNEIVNIMHVFTRAVFVAYVLREAARIFRESKISNEKSNFFLFYQNIPFCELVSKNIF